MGNAQTIRRAVESGEIIIRAEKLNVSVRCFVGFGAFKNFLSVMQDRAGRIKGNRSVGFNAGVMPAFPFGVVHRKHIIGENRTERKVSRRFFFQFVCLDQLDIHHATSSFCILLGERLTALFTPFSISILYTTFKSSPCFFRFFYDTFLSL